MSPTPSSPSLERSALSPRQSSEGNTSSSLPTSGNITTLGYGFSDGQIVYTAPITMGGDEGGLDGVPLRVQVDTGSGDVWLASRSCDSDSCTSSSSGNSVVRYDAAGQGARDINQEWGIKYLAGSASGSIFTQDLLIGGGIRLVDQAFGSASDVDGEDLRDMNVTGIMGLSFPANSALQEVLSPGNGQNFVHNYETGSVLNGLWSGTQRSPTTPRMFGLGLQRLPSDGGGRTANNSLSLGGIDRAYIPTSQDSRIRFSSSLQDSDGLHRHWKLYLTDVTTNGVDGVVHIPASYAGQSDTYPTVVLNSGAPLNYGPSDILNAMYGAFQNEQGNRLGPGENGIYYVPCNQPLNISLTIGGTQVPIHPLDASLSEEIGGGSGSGSSVSGCIGSFQSLKPGSPAGADIILGSPFLRSTYTIFSCDSIPNGSNATLFQQAVTGPCTNPAIGIYPTTTDAAVALQEFKQVRVNGEPLGSNSVAGIQTKSDSGGGLSTGAKAAIGIVVAIVFCIGAFGLLVWFGRRRALKQRKRATFMGRGFEGDGLGDANGAIALEEKSRSVDAQGGVGNGEHGGAGGFFDRKRSRSRSRTMSGGGRRFSDKVQGDLDFDDDDSQEGPNHKAMMSAKEQARLREAAILHGYYDEDLMGEDNIPHPAAATVQSPFNETDRLGVPSNYAPGQEESNASWDVSSSGYVDARRIRREYLKRHPSVELARRQNEIAENTGSEGDNAQHTGGSSSTHGKEGNRVHYDESFDQSSGHAL
ncbi:unnamed protein product [Sympodiomycopsis kandeliae]